jgi:hypothetical protein
MGLRQSHSPAGVVDSDDTVVETGARFVRFQVCHVAFERVKIPYEGYHRTAFFNPDVLDYISFPTHKIEEDEVESYDDGLTDDDDTDSDDAKVIKLPKARKNGRAK